MMSDAAGEGELRPRLCVDRTGEGVVIDESNPPLGGRMNRRNRTSNATLLARGR
jgi:hypothetical protein